MDFTQIFDAFFSQVVPAAGTVLVALIVKVLFPALVAWVERFGIRVSAEKRLYLEAEVEAAAVKAVRAAEEALEAMVKSKAVERADSGMLKLEFAIQTMMQKFPYLTEDQAAVIIQSVLKQVGLGAQAGTGFLKGRLETMAAEISAEKTPIQ